MPGASEEQTWWSDLFAGGADAGLDVPDGVWDAVVAAALDPETPLPVDDLVPADHSDAAFDELGVVVGTHHDFGNPPDHHDVIHQENGGGEADGLLHDSGHTPIANDTGHHDINGEELLHDANPDDSNVFDDSDQIDEL